MQVELTTERVARNQSTFRQANEEIELRAQELGVTEGRIPFICECPDPACTSIARLSLADYEMIRGRGNWFFAVPGHEVCRVDGKEVAKIAERFDVFTLMEKVGHAGEVAEQLDPRA